jgi:superfamily II DNA/RNA helicase
VCQPRLMPAPILSNVKYSSLKNLHPSLANSLSSISFEYLTEIQHKSWIPISSRKDTLLSAECASGKTASFIVPLANRLLTRKVGDVQKSPPVVVLSPNSKLSTQTFEFTESITLNGNIRNQLLSNDQGRIKWGSVDFIFGTPREYLKDLPKFERLSPSAFVFDEADQLLEGTFRSETAEIISSYSGQCIYAGATISSSLLGRIFRRHPNIEYLKSENYHMVHGNSIDFKWIRVNEGSNELQEKLIVLASTVLPKAKIEGDVLIFCNTKERVKKVKEFLSNTGWINQADKTGIQVLTDLGSRGLVYNECYTVVNFDFPLDASTFLHRAGRIGNKKELPVVFSLLTDKEYEQKPLVKLVMEKVKASDRLHSIFSSRRSLRKEYSNKM